MTSASKPTDDKEPEKADPVQETQDGTEKSPEYGGPKGPEPTRYNDWEQNGRCTDF